MFVQIKTLVYFSAVNTILRCIMKKTGIANLPLHGGKAPAWLFEKMVKLSAEISEIIVRDFGRDELLLRLSDPYWFQSFGCVLGFDWHSSGLTTTVCGALKEGLKDIGPEIGIYVCGGKGKTSRKTPLEIELLAPQAGVAPTSLIYASKMSAKVDNSAVFDGYQLYHHTFIFTKEGKWAVIQQGMNERARYARRYHWLNLDEINFTCDPHTGIASEQQGQMVLNMVAKASEASRKVSTELAQTKPELVVKDLARVPELTLPAHHDIRTIRPENLKKILLKTYEIKPHNFEELLATPGVGPRTIRALALIGELIYGTKPSYQDPATFSFAHGGKDGIPYPVDRENYDRSILVLQSAIERSKLGCNDKTEALRKLVLITSDQGKLFA